MNWAWNAYLGSKIHFIGTTIHDNVQWRKTWILNDESISKIGYINGSWLNLDTNIIKYFYRFQISVSNFQIFQSEWYQYQDIYSGTKRVIKNSNCFQSQYFLKTFKGLLSDGKIDEAAISCVFPSMDSISSNWSLFIMSLME